MKKIRLIFICLILIEINFTNCSGQNVIISSGGQTGFIDCAASTIDMQVDNPNPNYFYHWHYVLFPDTTGGGCGFISGPAIATGTNVSISTNMGSFFAIECQADSGGMIWDASHWFKVRKPDSKAPVCVNYTSACGEKLIIVPSVFYLIDSNNTFINGQWFRNGIPLNIDYLSPPTLTTSGYYYLRVQVGSCGYAYSDSIYVSINKPSAQITPSGTLTICQGGNVTLNASAGANKAYQWKKGGVNISGATLSSYSATVGGTYKVTVTNTVTGCSKTTTTGTVVTINPLPAATITPQGPTTFCAGGSVVLKANSGAGLTYQWKKGGTNISGATLMNYTATTAGVYKVKVTNNSGCTKISAGVTVTVPCRENEIVKTGKGESGFDVIVYPNPSSGDFIFEFQNAGTEKISINIFDVVGKLILSATNPLPKESSGQFTIPGTQLSPGVYSAQILSGKNKKLLRLIKTN